MDDSQRFLLRIHDELDKEKVPPFRTWMKGGGRFIHIENPNCESLAKRSNMTIHYKVGLPGYDAEEDKIHMPEPSTFITPEFYYGTLLHELVHGTGHETRLNRHETNKHKMHETKHYGHEELVAELGAMILGNECGILEATLGRSILYIEDWLWEIRGSVAALGNAYEDACRAAEYLLDYRKKQK